MALPWHHVHITVQDREAAAHWHAEHTPATRKEPTPRSENLVCAPNLMQIQSRPVASQATDAYLHSVGISTTDMDRFVARWRAAGGTVKSTGATAQLIDPWGLGVEVISGEAARSRGPGMRPASISLRITTSSRGFAEAAE